MSEPVSESESESASQPGSPCLSTVGYYMSNAKTEQKQVCRSNVLRVRAPVALLEQGLQLDHILVQLLSSPLCFAAGDVCIGGQGLCLPEGCQCIGGWAVWAV